MRSLVLALTIASITLAGEIAVSGSGTYTWTIYTNGRSLKVVYTGTCFVAGMIGTAIGTSTEGINVGSLVNVNGHWIPTAETIATLTFTPTKIVSFMPKIWCESVTYTKYLLSVTTLSPSVITLSGVLTLTTFTTQTFLTPIVTMVTTAGVQVPTIIYSTVTYAVPKTFTTRVGSIVTTTTPTVTMWSIITSTEVSYVMLPANPANLTVTNSLLTTTHNANPAKMPVTITIDLSEVTTSSITPTTTPATTTKVTSVALLPFLMSYSRRSKRKH